MAVTDEERLVVAIEARISEFEKRMVQAERRGTRTYGQLAAGSSRATKQMETDMLRSTSRINQAVAATSTKIGSFGRAFGGGLLGSVAGLGLAGIVSGLGSVAKGVAEIGDHAKIAGVNVRAFQELKFVAEQNRIGIDALTDGLKELNLRADEFIATGQGSAAESFKRLGYDAQTLSRKLKDPSALFSEIIGKLERLDKAAQIRIADELFGGTGGEQFVKLVEQGEAGIRAQIQAANDLGIVLDEKIIRKAEEVDRKFQIVATTVGTALKGAIVEAANQLGLFFDLLNDTDQRARSTIETQLQHKKDLLAKTERSNAARYVVDGMHGQGIANLKLEIKQLEAELARRTREGLRARLEQQAEQMRGQEIEKSGRLPASTSTARKEEPGLRDNLISGKAVEHVDRLASTFATKLEKMLDSVPDHLKGQIQIKSGFRSYERQEQLWQEALRKYGSVAEARKWVAPPGRSQHNKGNAADLSWGSGEAMRWAHQNAGRYGLSFPLGNEDWHIEDADARSGAMAEQTRQLEERGQAYDDVVAKAREFIAEQGLETRAIGMTTEAASRLRYEQDLLNEARQAGIDLSPSQIENIRALAGEMAKAEGATKRLALSQEELQARAEEFGAQAKDVVGGFISDLRRGEKASDAFKNALARIGDMLIDGALNQLFGGGGVSLGGLFGSLLGGVFGLPGFAKGTSFAPGGPAWVGENGPEIVNLPRGAEVVPNHRIGQMGGGSSKVDVAVTVGWSRTADGQLKPFVEDVSQKSVQRAAPSIVGTSVKRSKDQILPTIAQHQSYKTGGDYRNG